MKYDMHPLVFKWRLFVTPMGSTKPGRLNRVARLAWTQWLRSFSPTLPWVRSASGPGVILSEQVLHGLSGKARRGKDVTRHMAEKQSHTRIDFFWGESLRVELQCDQEGRVRVSVGEVEGDLVGVQDLLVARVRASQRRCDGGSDPGRKQAATEHPCAVAGQFGEEGLDLLADRIVWGPQAWRVT